MTQPTTPAPGEDSKGFWRNLILWALLALLLRWLVVEPRWIPSGSMLPTLQLQDRILVEKVRPRLARSRHSHLNRGDVVVFAPPEQLVADLNLRLVQMEQRQQELITEVQTQRTEVQNQRRRSDSAEQELLAARAQAEAHRVSLQALQAQLTQQGSATASVHQQH